MKADSLSTTGRLPALRSRKPTAMVSHMEQILNAVPEVESTSRRTGLELGLAAVTEANRGDILVKLKERSQPRHRRRHGRSAEPK